jgi:hypothetical protein
LILRTKLITTAVTLLICCNAVAQETLGEQLIGSILLKSNIELSKSKFDEPTKNYVKSNILALVGKIDPEADENVPVWLNDIKTLDHLMIGRCVNLGATDIPFFGPEEANLLSEDEYIESVACVKPGNDLKGKIADDSLNTFHIGFVIGQKGAKQPVLGELSRIMIWADVGPDAGYEITTTLWTEDSS